MNDNLKDQNMKTTGRMFCRIFEAYHLEFSSLIRQLVGLGDLFCQLNGPEQRSFVTRI